MKLRSRRIGLLSTKGSVRSAMLGQEWRWRCLADHGQIEEIYERLTSVGDSGTPSSAEQPLAAQSTSSLPQPPPTVKQEVKPVISVPEPAPVKAEEMHVETDAEMAARLQREFNTESSGRASRSGGAAPRKKKAVKRKSQPTLGSDGEPVPKKKRAGGGGGAFNKELMLR